MEWRVLDGLQEYEATTASMEAEADRIAAGEASEKVWLLEHPPLYTGGTSAKADDHLGLADIPVFQTNRGGQYTYHGPGQRVAYAMLDVKARGGDVRAFVAGLEEWIIRTLARFNIHGERRSDRVGVWVKRPGFTNGAEDKIAALGIRIRKGVSFHGIAINIAPDLSHFAGIVPCGITNHGVTSFEGLGQIVSMEEVDMALRAEFETLFAPTV